jgi:hypothetical protein
MSNSYVMLSLASELLSLKRRIDEAQARFDTLSDQLKEYASLDGVTELSVNDGVSDAKFSFVSSLRFNAEEAAATLPPNVSSIVVKMKPSVTRSDVDRAVKMGLLTLATEVPHTITTSLRITFPK